MKQLLLSLSVLLAVLGMGFAHADSVDNAVISILDYDGQSASVQASFVNDDGIAKYEMGCVSCMPNISDTTSGDEITLSKVTPMPNSSNAMLYLIAYDSNDEIVHAKQIVLNLEE